jgi:hypothetical protein
LIDGAKIGLYLRLNPKKISTLNPLKAKVKNRCVEKVTQNSISKKWDGSRVTG